MYHDCCAILCQDSDRPGDARTSAFGPIPSTTAPRATGELDGVHRGGGEEDAGRARDGGARGGRRARWPRRRPRRRQSRRAHDPGRPLRLLRRRHHPGRRGQRSPGTGTRRRWRPAASALEFERRAEELGGTAPDVQSQSRGARLGTLQGRRRPARPGGRRRAAAPLPRDRAHRRGRSREGRAHGEQVGQAGDPRAARRGRLRRRRRRFSRRGALSRASAWFGDGCDRHVHLLRRRQGALPRPRRRERTDLRRLGQVLERQRRTARRTTSSAPTCRSRSTGRAARA